VNTTESHRVPPFGTQSRATESAGPHPFRGGTRCLGRSLPESQRGSESTESRCSGLSRELTRDELLAEAGERRRACLCASWELAAVGRCVCPEASEPDAPDEEDDDEGPPLSAGDVDPYEGGIEPCDEAGDVLGPYSAPLDAYEVASNSRGRSETQGSRACASGRSESQKLTRRLRAMVQIPQQTGFGVSGGQCLT
jgi:hypothetical protein